MELIPCWKLLLQLLQCTAFLTLVPVLVVAYPGHPGLFGFLSNIAHQESKAPASQPHPSSVSGARHLSIWAFLNAFSHPSRSNPVIKPPVHHTTTTLPPPPSTTPFDEDAHDRECGKMLADQCLNPILKKTTYTDFCDMLTDLYSCWRPLGVTCNTTFDWKLFGASVQSLTGGLHVNGHCASLKPKYHVTRNVTDPACQPQKTWHCTETAINNIPKYGICQGVLSLKKCLLIRIHKCDYTAKRWIHNGIRGIWEVVKSNVCHNTTLTNN